MEYDRSELPDFLFDYINYLIAIKETSPKTVEGYFYDLRIFLRWLKKYSIPNCVPKNTKLDQVSIKDLEIEHLASLQIEDLHNFLAYTKKNLDNSPPARARKVACLRAFFKYLTVKRNLLSSNPAAELESPKLPERIPKYLNANDSQELLTSIEGEFAVRNFAIFSIFLCCGIRVSELVNINLKDIDGDKITIIGKGDKQRVAYMTSDCIEAVNEYRLVRPNNRVIDKDALFLSKLNKRISVDTVQQIVKKYAVAAGLDPSISPHKLRHTFATLLYKTGKVGILELKELLGHKSISTTQIYTHVDEKNLREAVQLTPLSFKRGIGKRKKNFSEDEKYVEKNF
jgi:site-specific recombinase XerD